MRHDRGWSELLGQMPCVYGILEALLLESACANPLKMAVPTQNGIYRFGFGHLGRTADHRQAVKVVI
jgi:hypothetical protein